MRSPLVSLTLAVGLLVMHPSSVPAKPRISPQGTCHAVALFARFADADPGPTSIPSEYAPLFDPELPGSLSHFYHEMSLGTFTIQGTVLPTYYTSPRKASDYPSHPQGYFGAFNREILDQADRNLDFGLFDNDGPDGRPNSGDDDGYVDYVFILVEDKQPGFLPGTAAGIAKLGLEEDFITDDPAPSGSIRIASGLGATQRVWSFERAVAVMAHEFAHALGLPDLYDLSYGDPEEDSGGIGNWGIMGQGATGWEGSEGPVSFCAWSREQLGWAHVVEITQDKVGQVLTDVATTGALYKISLSQGRAYYLLENRQSTKSYYDRAIPEDGLLIWHIQYPFRDPGDPNANENRKGVDLVCADGLYLDRGYPHGTQAAPEMGWDNLDFWAHDEGYRRDHTGNLGDATDVFDGIRFKAFTPHTNPQSQGEIWIGDIRRRGTDLVADIQVPTWERSITQDVTWEDRIHVTGDIVVPKGITLTIHSGTVVRFSPTDTLRSGADPDRCEIDVFGTLRIRTMGHPGPVRLTTEGKGTWVGIRLHEDTASLSWYMNPALHIEDCHHPRGIFWSDHPEAKKPDIFRSVVQDQGEGGNGDEVLDPGEQVELILDIHNWTTRRFRVHAFSSEDPFVTDLQKASFKTLIPGRTEVSGGWITVDPGCPDGHRIAFHVEFVDAKGITETDTFSIGVQGIPERAHNPIRTTDVEGAHPVHALPVAFALKQNTPNPFNAETVISFDLPHPADLRLTIFNAMGQSITRWEGYGSAGEHSVIWNGQNEEGIPVASGVYFYRLETGSFVGTKRMALLE